MATHSESGRSREQLLTSMWTVTAVRSRVASASPARTPRTPARRGDRLPSDATVVGAIQVPPDGQPIVLLADYGATGGYPVIATVVADVLDKVVEPLAGRS